MSERGAPQEEPERPAAGVRFVTKRSGHAAQLSSTCRSAEEVLFRPPSRFRRQAQRLSGVFIRGPGSMALTAALRSSRSVQTRKGSMFPADVLPEDDPAELSSQITAPGILKIFGNEICEGAHYKSVLATTHSSAKELVKEALDRYGLSKREADAYVLCDTIGSIHSRQWRTEAFRVVGDHEKPLVLQSLWKPREGLARRFEIQKRSLVEEQTSREKDTVTAGLNAQARKLQKSRSRVSSTLLERAAGSKLWRSKSEMDLLDPDTKQDPGFIRQNLEPTPEQNPAAPRGGAQTGSLRAAKSAGEREGEESEREETESSGDNTTQYSLHPPHDCPYLLLLQGRSAQDFVIYLLAAPLVGVGRHTDGPKNDISLHAADILPQHCHFLRRRPGEPVVLRPSTDASVTKNGEVLRSDAPLSPGDVIGLGRHYLFLFKDPSAPLHQDGEAPDLSWSSWSCSPSAARRSSQTLVCSSCVSDLQPPAGAAGALSLSLNYEAEDEERLVKKIVAMRGGGRAPLSVSFLLSLCLHRSSSRLRGSDLRRLLLLIASNCQTAVWEHTKNAAAARPDVHGDEAFTPEELQALRLDQVLSGLRPLVLWMSNSLELLHFIQYQLPLILEWRSQTALGGGEEEDIKTFEMLELRLPCIRSVSEETSSALEEVLLLSFQQCVFYITKFLHPVLPALLDCNPFSGGPGSAPGGLRVPAEVRQVLQVLDQTGTLLSDCRVHPDVSAQLLGYVFYFISASLFNSFMEGGSEPGFYHWSRGVRMRANLDLLLDWAHAAGLGDLALENTQALSSAINLLATPPKKLLQCSWAGLRSEYPSLSAAQLNHLLSLYSPAPPCRQAWTPSPQDLWAARQTSAILQSFDSHHPLLLPDGGYQLQLTATGTEPALMEELDRLKEFISGLSAPQGEDVLNEEAQTRTLQTASRSSEELAPSRASVQNSSWSTSTSPSSHPFTHQLSSHGARSPSQELRHVEQQARKTPEEKTADPLTPPATPHGQDDPLRKTSPADGRGFESPTALTADGCRLELEEEEEEEGGDEEVFSLELERGEGGLGLALKDSEDKPLKRVGGIFIHAVLPESPAAQQEKLEAGDRILIELDHQSGREWIRSSGTTLRLLVGGSSCEGPAVQSGF